MKFAEARDEVIWHKILKTQTPKERTIAYVNRAIIKIYQPKQSVR